MFEGHKKKELEKEPHVLSNMEANSALSIGLMTRTILADWTNRD